MKCRLPNWFIVDCNHMNKSLPIIDILNQSRDMTSKNKYVYISLILNSTQNIGHMGWEAKRVHLSHNTGGGILKKSEFAQNEVCSLLAEGVRVVE